MRVCVHAYVYVHVCMYVWVGFCVVCVYACVCNVLFVYRSLSMDWTSQVQHLCTGQLEAVIWVRLWALRTA